MLLRSAPSLRSWGGARALGVATSRHRASSPLPLRGCGSCARGGTLASFQLRGQASAFPFVPPPPCLHFTAVNRQFTAVTLTVILSGGTAAAGGNPRKVLRGSSPSRSILGNPRQVWVCAQSAPPIFSRGVSSGFQPVQVGALPAHPPPSPCPAPFSARAPPLRPIASLLGRCSCARALEACPVPTCPPPAARRRLHRPIPPDPPAPQGRGAWRPSGWPPNPPTPLPPHGGWGAATVPVGWSRLRSGWVFCALSLYWFSLPGPTPAPGGAWLSAWPGPGGGLQAPPPGLTVIFEASRTPQASRNPSVFSENLTNVKYCLSLPRLI